MTIDLKNLAPAPGAVRSRKRVGRGPGSGSGKTASRGQKGLGARSGGTVSPGFEGGQMPLQRRLPKRGFRNHSRVEFEIVSLGRLGRFPEGTVVDPELLRRERIVRGTGPIKILSDGEPGTKLTVKAHGASRKAREKIEAAGGTLEVLTRA